MQEFFSLEEAAEWLSRKTDEPVSVRAILEKVEALTLPVCFKYWGSLGFPLLSETCEIKIRLYSFHGYLRASVCAVGMPQCYPLLGLQAPLYRLQPQRVSVAKVLSSDPTLDELAFADYSRVVPRAKTNNFNDF